jgi:hypothetical protein
MQIRELTIKNYRGIESLTWRPPTPLTSIVGPGDVGKTTVLDGIEAALAPRWATFTDADFHYGDTSRAIEVSVTVGELPEEALREHRMGMHLRGWSSAGDLHDEPEANDEAVATIRLTVDASLDPSWELVCDHADGKTLTPRDRALFGLVRLGGDVDRHFTWAHGSALARLSADKNKAAPLLAEAYRRAKELLSEGSLPDLDKTAETVRNAAVMLGAYASKTYAAGLDMQRASMSLGVLSLHEAGVPIRMAGLGTRRLVALAIERLSIPEGAIVLIDEVEHGLEPHRIRRALSTLRASVSATSGQNRVGQVIMTTHSAISLVELACPQLSVARRTKDVVVLQAPAAVLQPLVRRVPEAFLARSVVVCEGKTEVGLLRGMRAKWAQAHDDEPLESKGVVFADGNGTEAVSTACELAKLGYRAALLRDSDVVLSTVEKAELSNLSVNLFEWDGACATEERILLDVSDGGVQQLLDLAAEFWGEASVLDVIRARLGTTTPLPREFARWSVAGKTTEDLRRAIGEAAKKKDWFKRIEPGERMGTILAREVTAQSGSPIARTLAGVEGWAYGG